MAIAKLPKAQPKTQDDFISQGGSVTAQKEVKEDSESCHILLRMPKQFLQLLDDARNKKPSKPYRNQFILELLDKALQTQVQKE